MADDKARIEELIHQVNNLLGVIAVQSAVARQAGSETGYAAALDAIEKAATRTQEVVKRLRDAGAG